MPPTASETDKYAEYTYLGAATIVTVAHPDVSGGLELTYGSAGTYGGFDRFRLRPAGFGGQVGRVVDQKWQDDSSNVVDRFEYTYDRGSNRTSRDLTLTGGLDEKYTYDDLDRLTAADRGTLSGGSITSRQYAEDWSLTQTGNWADYKFDADDPNMPDELAGLMENWGSLPDHIRNAISTLAGV